MRTARALLCLALLLGPTSAVDAQTAAGAPPIAPSAAHLRGSAEALAGDDFKARHRALLQLLTLGRGALPAIRGRLTQLRSLGVDGTKLAPKLIVTRRIHADTRTSELAAALNAALQRDRSLAMVQAVELTALVHALSVQHTIEAADVLVGQLFALAPAQLRAEATRARKRLGGLLMPAYLRHAGRGQPAMQRLCRAALGALGASTPRQAFERADAALLPSLLGVYRLLRTPEALPWIATYVGDPRLAVHEAAVEAARAYGQAALPFLRQRTLQLTGSAPGADADAAAILHALAARNAEPRTQLLAKVEALLKDEKLFDATHQLDRLIEPGIDRSLAPRAATTYVALATKQEAAGKQEDALRSYRRATRLAPDDEAGRAARARALHLETQLRLGGGIADVHSLEEAVSLDPTLTQAADLLAEVRGDLVAEDRARRRVAGLLAAAMLAISATLLLRDARHRGRQLGRGA